MNQGVGLLIAFMSLIVGVVGLTSNPLQLGETELYSNAPPGASPGPTTFSIDYRALGDTELTRLEVYFRKCSLYGCGVPPGEDGLAAWKIQVRCVSPGSTKSTPLVPFSSMPYNTWQWYTLDHPNLPGGNCTYTFLLGVGGSTNTVHWAASATSGESTLKQFGFVTGGTPTDEPPPDQEPPPEQDTDTDGDTVPDLIDNCPEAPNTDQADADADGIGDACEEDKTLGMIIFGGSILLLLIGLMALAWTLWLGKGG